MRKKLTAIIMMAIMAIGFAGISPVFAAEAETKTVDLNFAETSTLEFSDFAGFNLSFEKISDDYKTYDAEHKGTDMFIRYTTDAYEDGVTYEKWCRVYLPYGYDPEDKETKYDIIYFNHGDNSNPNNWFDHKDKAGHSMTNVFDNIMDPEYGFLKPCIVVCPTYYFHTSEDKWNTPPNTDCTAGDGRFEGVVPNYYKELVEDIIPAVEGQLNTYCEDTSEEGILASRDHRACGGFSRGGACTWYLFSHDMPYFKYWLPISFDVMREGLPLGGEHDPEDSYQYLKEVVDANPEKDFYIFACAGGPDEFIHEEYLGTKMAVQMRYFLDHEDSIFSNGLNPEENNFFFTSSDAGHSDACLADFLYNIKDVLFGGELSATPSVTAKTVEVEIAPAEPETPKAEVVIPEEYTKKKEFTGTFGFGPAKVTAATNDDESIFLLAFDCFGEAQRLEGTLEDGVCTVTFDQTGFMSGDCQKIWDSAVEDAGEWIAAR